MIEMDALQRQLLIEGLDDWVGLWRVARKVREILGEVPTDLAREAAVRRLRPLLIGGYIEAGYSPYEKGQFEPWGLPPEAAISRIDSEWRDLADDPNIWEICRFRNTEKGDALAQSLVKNEVGYPDSVGQ